MSGGRALSVAVFLLAAVGVPRGADGQAYQTQGAWTSSGSQLDGTWRAAIDAAGTAIGGAFSITGMPGLTQGTITGTLREGAIDFDVGDDGAMAVFVGSVTGDSISGTFVTQVGVTGQWSGSFGSAVTTVPPTSGPEEPPATPAAPTS